MNDIASPERQVLGSRALRLKRARRLVIAFAVFVLAPTLVAAVYYSILVDSQYESVAVLSLDAGGETEGAKKAPLRDLGPIREHIRSRAMLDKLAKHHDLLGHYRRGDWWSALSHDAGSEETFEYFREHVVVDPEPDDTLSLRVFAFSGENAHTIARAIIDETHRHLEERMARAREDALSAVGGEVEAAEKRLVETPASDPVKVEVARQRLAAALRAQELAEAEVASRRRGLWVVAEPSTPNEPSRPRRLWNIATVFVTALALGAVALLLGDFVREHAKF